MTKRIVVALGGNALSKDGAATAKAQSQIVEQTTAYLAEIIKNGYQMAIVHGNGPQIGNIILHEEAINTDKTPTMPIDVCGAMSQGQIGYWIQNKLGQQLKQADLNLPVASLVTQVEVDANDAAFTNPSKPIGPFYSADEAQKLKTERGFTVKEDAGRGWRRVVPSPKPINIIEADFIKNSLAQNMIVITAGGGGIPVRKTDVGLEGLEAVIDKDFAAEKLAELIEADVLLILTAVDNVKINFNQPNEQNLSQMTIAEAKQYVKEGQFAAGSMLPKVEAAIKFVESGADRRAIIASPEQALLAIQGQAGTTIK